MTPLAEDEALQRIRHMLGNRIEPLGLQDDAAVLFVPADARLVASVDSVASGVHVDLSLSSPADVGWKALMRALSDLAAMGASPLGALVALCVPSGEGPKSSGQGGEREDGEGALTLGVMAGVAEASAASGCAIVGGDVSASQSGLVVSVTVLGTVPGAASSAGSNAVARSGARPGDAVLVTGPCGASAAGLRLLRRGAAAGSEAGSAAAAADSETEIAPATGGVAGQAIKAYRRPEARLREGSLARQGGAHAMIDVSDGLALDLHRLADASNVGFVLDEVPVAAGATLEEALGGGEDYELVLAVGDGEVGALADAFADAGLRVPLRIGSFVDDAELRALGGQPLGRKGWQHRLG
jgi:thiamine-monophosphate kinase